MSVPPRPQGTLSIHGTFIRDLSFENPHVPYKITEGIEPKINISYDISATSLKDNFYEVVLSTYVSATLEEQSFFIIEVKFAGLFNIAFDDKEELEKVLYIQCPNILQPYVRRIVSELTTEGGMASLLLQPVDFFGLYLEKKAQLQSNNTSSITTN